MEKQDALASSVTWLSSPSQLQLWSPDSQSFLINLSASLWTLPISKESNARCENKSACNTHTAGETSWSQSNVAEGHSLEEGLPPRTYPSFGTEHACARCQPLSSHCQFKCHLHAGSWFIASHATALASWKWECLHEAPDATTERRTHGVKVSLNDAVGVGVGQAADTVSP